MGGMGDHLDAEMLKIDSKTPQLRTTYFNLHSSSFHVSLYQFPPKALKLM